MEFSKIKELEARCGLPCNQKRNICFVRGENNRLFDLSGRGYLDFAWGDENCLGYSNAALLAALERKQGALIGCHGYNQSQSLALSRLVSDTGFNKAALVQSAEVANIAALSIIKSYWKQNNQRRKQVVVAMDEFSAMAGCAFPSFPYNITSDLKAIEINDFPSLKKSLNADTAALIIEPIRTDGAVTIAAYDYIISAYALCKSMDILLLCDETRTGLWRTGSRFAYQSYGIQPDIVTLSRGLSAGFNIGAVLSRDDIGECYKGQADCVSALACSAAEAVLSAFDSKMIASIAQKGEYMMTKLCRLSKHNFVLDIRGKGLFAGIELSGLILAAKIVNQMEKLGFLIGHTEDNVLKFCPPFTITKAEIDAMFDALSDIFAQTNI